ncbi:hypothetical protein EGW08_009441 [Elysia chlorotica]|uniref:Mitochondrial import receptor subunit TOM70 n=1 Tax=Elysia chlorotica TaxID=188477 RepID=A0A433TMR0_ELYCH|nr:hypothetical protein EGW08_009441 [Elysia chlorotica]
MATRSIVPQQLKDLTEGWSKWDIALYVGAPIALGVAGLWYYNRSKSIGNEQVGSGDYESVQRPHTSGSVSDKPSPKSTSKPQAQSRQELAQAAKNSGNKCFKEGKYEEAIKFYTEAIMTCPPDVKGDMSTFYQNRAAAYENLKKYEEVVEDCTAALGLNPKYSKALARRSKAYEVMESYRDSLEDITKACLIEGFQNQAYLMAADRVLKTLGKVKAAEKYKTKSPTKPSTFYIDNYLAGFVNDPVARCFAPQSTTAKLKDLGISMKGGAGGQGEQEEEEADKIGDNGAVMVDIPSAFDRVKNCLALKEYDQVIPLCDEELENERSGKIPEALLLRGTMKLLQGMGDSALEDFTRITAMAGLDKTLQATALIREGCLRMQRESAEECLLAFSKAETVDPDNSDVFHHHGQQLLQLEKLDEAMLKFDRSIKLSPNFPTSYIQKYYAVHRKAIMTENMSLLNEAKAGFEKAIAKFPTCSDALILYAQSLSDQGKFEEAEAYFKKAQQVQPLNANNIVHRGLMMLQWQGNVEGTMSLLSEALKVDPTCQYAYEIKGTIEVQR